ncbi:hypothetical protein NDU88_005085 [Pleurodeles waltl]|uniref:Uncharacterized protein n=1 Tax=Pleurodeles waltl TaxID=8319 RepID=A0AAV7MWF4_PLEWA|nr:hypothetical protein NDU88_005085 [Pleurodeles waltl]
MGAVDAPPDAPWDPVGRAAPPRVALATWKNTVETGALLRPPPLLWDVTSRGESVERQTVSLGPARQAIIKAKAAEDAGPRSPLPAARICAEARECHPETIEPESFFSPPSRF